MANQPKKYKKFVATAATATLVASAIVPVASAASFTDVTDTNSHKDAISNLVDAGIIKGYPDGTFKPDQYVSRGQVVKLLGRWLETEGNVIPTDWNTKQRFNDLPVTTADKELVQYAALVKDAGAFNGANGNLNYSQNMARQQMAIVLVRAIKEIQGVDLVKEYKDAKFTSEISDLGGLNTEQREAITALEYAELTKAATLPGKAFKPNDTITRAQFASFLDRTMKLEVTAPAKAAVKAINNTTVEVTFDKEVDNVQALNFEIKDLEVKNAAVKLTNKKVVVLTTAAQTADKEYTVSLGGETIGKFKGVSAVVPTKVDLVEKSTQGKLGQQVTLKAQVTVAEGASKAGVPVTFFIPGSANGVKAPVTVEAVTNDEGIATYSYTRYAATNDTVTVYANGDRSKFSTGYVFWAVDQTLTITEVTEGSTINNGANKVYKVTYKDPETGKPVSGKTLNVSVKENIDVTVDKLQNVTVNGTAVVQTNDVNTKASQIKTDSKGEATFTVTGSNAEVTPVVFDAAPVTTTNANGTVTTTGYTQKYTADTLQATAAKVKFGALQAEYTLDVTRDGNETAATGYENGRKYKVVVKTKDGKLAANETVNVAFNEDIDGVISTTTEAKFVKVESDGSQKGYDYTSDKNAKKITVKTNSKGEASFVIGNDKVNTYATPIVWIDINNHTGKDANLDKGEPFAIAPISYFQEAYIDGAKLVAKNDKDKDTTEFEGQPATFKVVLVNQSGKEMKGHGYSLANTSYSIFNDGANTVLVGKEEVAPNRSINVTGGESIEVSQFEGKASSVKVTATGVAKKTENGVVKDFSFTSKDATAKFLNSSEITNPYTGILDLNSIDKDEKEIKFEGKKKAVKYAGESGKTYKYLSGTSTIAGEKAFIELLEEYKVAGKKVRVTYEVKDDVVTFTIVSVTDGNGTGNVTDVVAKVNAATNADQVKAAIADLKEYKALSAESQTKAVDNILKKLAAGTTFTPASLVAELKVEITSTAVYTAATQKVDAKPAVGTYTDAADNTKTVEIASKDGETAYNGVSVKFVANTDTTKADVETSYADKVLTVKLPTTAIDAVTGKVTYAPNATFEKAGAAIDAFNGGALKATLGAGATGDASKLVNDSVVIKLDGASAEVAATDAKLELTFSEAVSINTPANALELNIDGVKATIATGNYELSADGLKLTLKTGATSVKASSVIKDLTNVKFNDKLVVYPTSITVK